MLKDPKTLISVFLFIRNGNNKGAQLIRRTMKATQSKHLMISCFSCLARSTRALWTNGF